MFTLNDEISQPPDTEATTENAAISDELSNSNSDDAPSVYFKVTNIFIVNLAIGDILMAILCIPFTFISNLLLQYWPFGSTLCAIVCYSQAVSVFISAYTLVAISIDRYMAIIFPLKIRMSKQQAQLIILLIWLVALLTPLPTAFLSTLVAIPLANQTNTNLTNEIDTNLMNSVNRDESPSSPSFDTVNSLSHSVNRNLNSDSPLREEELAVHSETQKYICQEQWPDKTQRYYYSITLMILQYFLPLTVLIFTYAKIAFAVFGRPVAANQDQIRANEARQKMIKMMILVCVVYSLCWLPLNLLIVISDVYENIWQFSYIIYIWLISHLLAMSHCSVNPFIYIWMNNRFRSGFKLIYFRLLSLCGLTPSANGKANCKDFQHSVHNYSIQTQLTQRRTCNSEQHRLKQHCNDNSNNSNEPVDIELALVSDNTDNNNNTNHPAALEQTTAAPTIQSVVEALH